LCLFSFTFLRSFSTAALNLVLGISAFALDSKLGETKILFEEVKGKTPNKRKAKKKQSKSISISSAAVFTSVLVFGISGFAAMVSQVAWTRVFSLAIGSTIYAFSIIVAAFILGLAIGGAIAARKVDQSRDLIRSLAFVQMGIGVSSAMILPLLGWSPVLFVKLILKYVGSFNWLLSLEFLVIAALILVPTLLMGATFPLVSKIYDTRLKNAGQAVGAVYAVNTVGAIVGAFFVGFVLIPWLGIQKTLSLAVFLFLLSGIVLYSLSTFGRKPYRLALLAFINIAIVGGSMRLGEALESWNPMVLTSGLYMLSDKKGLDWFVQKGNLGKHLKKQENELRYYKEGITGTVAVVEQNGIYYLKVGGKTDATSFGDMPTQILLAHVPMLLHQNPKDALVIGLGSGVTLGSVLNYPSIRKVDVLEISDEVIEAVRDLGFFDRVNGRPFKDDLNRVNLITSDARNHVALTSSKYDVIISEPSNPWMAGMAMFFTKEHLQNASKLLEPGGLVCQWLPAYRISKQDFLTVISTFASVFEHVGIWESIPGVDYLLIGSQSRQSIDHEEFTKLISEPSIQGDLSRLLIADLPAFLSYYLANDEQLRVIAQNYPINTDDNVRLEYSAPRNLFNFATNSISFNEMRMKSKIAIENINLPGDETKKLLGQIKQVRIGRGLVLEATWHHDRGRLEPALQALQRGLNLNQNDWNGRELEIKMRMDAVRNSLQLGQFEKALKRLNKVKLLPGQPEFQFNQYKSIAYQGLRKENPKSN